MDLSQPAGDQTIGDDWFAYTLTNGTTYINPNRKPVQFSSNPSVAEPSCGSKPTVPAVDVCSLCVPRISDILAGKLRTCITPFQRYMYDRFLLFDSEIEEQCKISQSEYDCIVHLQLTFAQVLGDVIDQFVQVYEQCHHKVNNVEDMVHDLVKEAQEQSTANEQSGTYLVRYE